VGRKPNHTKTTENNMKTNITMTLLAACGTLALTSGCNKPDTATSDTTEQMQAATNSAVEAQEQADATKLAADKAAADKALADKAATDKAALDQAAADKAAQAAAAQEQSRIQGLIDTAKGLTGQNKYAEALKTLNELANVKLSPEQQSVVDTLKAAIQKQATQAVADKAASTAQSAVGNVLNNQN
jgi:hypothetical protein